MENSMETKSKMTKIQAYEVIIDILSNIPDCPNCEDLIDFCEHQIEQLNKRKEVAAKRAEKKRETTDPMLQDILNLMSEGVAITVDEITNALNARRTADTPEVTRNKVVPRLTKLINSGNITKEVVRIDKLRKNVYTLLERELLNVETDTEEN